MVLTKEQKDNTVFTQLLSGREQVKNFDKGMMQPKDWTIVELISRDYTISGKSIFLAYDEDRNESAATLFIGTLND